MTTFTSHEDSMPCWTDAMVVTEEQQHDARAFLTAIFDWTWALGTPEMGFYDIASSNGHPVFGLGRAEGVNGVRTIYFATSNIEDAVARAVELGATVAFPVHHVGTAGWMSILVDPTGAVFGLWQAEDFHGFGVEYEENAPGWFDHSSANPEGAGAFYSAFSGHDLTTPGPDMRILQRGEQWYASVSKTMNGESPRWNPIYVVDSLKRIHETVPRHGGAIILEEMPVPGSAICVFSEPVNGQLLTVMRGGEHEHPH